MAQPPAPQKNKRLLLNLAFLLSCGAILFFLLNAPEETTAILPHDEDHNRFQGMKKKEAEAFCTDCHAPDKIAPLPANHPPKYRCLFCHKRK